MAKLSKEKLQQKAVVLDRLAKGEAPEDVAEDFQGVFTYTTILSWASKDAKVMQQDKAITKAAKVDDSLIDTIGELSKEDDPEDSEDIDNTLKGIKGVKRLDERSQAVGMNILNKANDLIKQVKNPRDLQTLAQTVQTVHTTFVNPQNPVIQMQQNNNTSIQAGKLNLFKQAMKD